MNNLTVTGLITPSAGTPSLRGAPVDLTVTGLITPSACTPTLANGGVIDYGQISSKDLHSDSGTVLTSQTMQLSVTCDASHLFALESIDNRANSAPKPGTYGLGLINETQKLGGYTITLRNAVADGVAVQPITSLDQGKTWSGDNRWVPGMYVSVAPMERNRQPVPVQNLRMELILSPTIARSDNLTLSNEVSLDGSVTLTVRYL